MTEPEPQKENPVSDTNNMPALDVPPKVDLTPQQLNDLQQFVDFMRQGTHLEDRWLTPDQVSEWLGVAKDWLYDQVAKGALPHAKFGRQLRFHKTEMRRWIQDQRDLADRRLLEEDGL